MVKNPKDLLSGLLFMLVGAGALYVSSGYRLGTARSMGPGYFPMLLGGLLVLLAAILVARSFFGPRVRLDGVNLKALVLILGGSLIFALLLRPAGLVAAILVTVLLGAAASREAKLKSSLFLAAGLACASAVVFVILLGQPLPLVGYWFQG